MTDEPIYLTEGDRRLLVAALLQYRSHLVGYLLPQALEDRDEYTAETCLLRDGHAERLADKIRGYGSSLLDDGEN